MIMLTRTAVQANLQVTEDSSFKVLCSKGMQSTRENVLPDQKNKQIPLCKLKLGHDTQKSQPWKSAATCQRPDSAHPVPHSEARPAENGADEGPTQDGRGPADLGVSVSDVVQDIRDVLLICGDRPPSCYASFAFPLTQKLNYQQRKSGARGEPNLGKAQQSSHAGEPETPDPS